MLVHSNRHSFFSGYSTEELLAFNKTIVTIVRERQLQKSTEASRKLSVGMNVYFNHSKTGEKISGIVTKINKKTVKIKSPTVLWSVSTTMVKVAA